MSRIAYPFRNLRTGRVVMRKYPLGGGPDIGSAIESRGDTLVRRSCSEISAKVPGGHLPANWPQVSTQRFRPEDFRRIAANVKAHTGVTLGYDPKTQRLKYDNRGHKRDTYRAMKWFDPDAGYGDKAPENE